jgi:hypothetical protein
MPELTFRPANVEIHRRNSVSPESYAGILLNPCAISGIALMMKSKIFDRQCGVNRDRKAGV